MTKLARVTPQCMSIRLTPTGRLRWEPSGDEAVPAESASLQDAFQADWCEALFTLAAAKMPVQGLPSVRYWQQLAERYLTGLCHVPEDAERFEVEAPSSADCAHWILTAPPMQGGEYLSEDTLQRIWAHLDEWTHDAVTAAGGLAAFLQERAPKWHQVGRVCFHLAENRGDDARPFAFMATYASGFGAAGRLKHLPLRKALEQYAGAKNRAALIKLLSPVQQAAEVCDWVAVWTQTQGQPWLVNALCAGPASTTRREGTARAPSKRTTSTPRARSSSCRGARTWTSWRTSWRRRGYGGWSSPS